MKINKLFSDKRTTDRFGLKPIKLEKIGNIVALIGKNGSGKSRILNLIPNYLKTISVYLIYSNYFSNIPDSLRYSEIDFNSMNDLLESESNIQELILLKSYDPNNNIFDKELEKYKNKKEELKRIGILSTNNADFKKLLDINKYIQENVTEYYTVINIEELQKIEIDKSKYDVVLTSLINNEDYEYKISEDIIIKNGAFYYLSLLAHQLSDLKYELSQSELINNNVYNDYITLKNIIKLFLNKDLEHVTDSRSKTISIDNGVSGIKGKFLLDNRDIKFNEFSPGQKVLFAFCFYLFIKQKKSKTKISDKIYIIDEIESHLHPEVQILLLDKLREIVGNTGQLWFATHSTDILTNLTLDEIYYVENGEIHKPSSIIPEKVYEALLGNNINIKKHSNFILDISYWAYINFISECFQNPNAMSSTRQNDPQIKQFNRIVSNSSNFTLLDFGAGKGRLFKELKKEFNNRFEYYAIDSNIDNINEMKKNGISNAFKNLKSIIGVQFDFVIMMNALHEIDIREWVKIFKEIFKYLKDDGLLIILEDKYIPKGEMPNEIGFLILDLQELQYLFKMSELPSSITLSKVDYKERLLCAMFSKSQIENIDDFSVKGAINLLNKNSYKKIKELKNDKNMNYIKKGHHLAIYTQLLINSKYALEVLDSIN